MRSNGMKSMSEEYDPEKVVGIPYHRGMLPYGGGVGPDGRVVFALTREDGRTACSEIPGTHRMSEKNFFGILIFFIAKNI